MPPQEPDYEVTVPLEQEIQDICPSGEDADLLERPMPPMIKLTEKDLFLLAHFLHGQYATGFTWGELPFILQEIVTFIGPNPQMSLKEKRKAGIDVLHYLMVSMDPLYLPEKATDPFFEALAAPYLKLAFTLFRECSLLQPSKTAPLDPETLMQYSGQIQSYFEGGLTWKDLALATHYALTYILSYEGLSVEAQTEGVYTVLEKLLSEASPEELPPHFDHSLYVAFLKPFIALQLSILSTS